MDTHCNEPNVIRWGIMGTGRISHDFVTAVRNNVSDCSIVAVGSRRAQNAEDFATLHDIDRSYGSYDELVQDSQVDIVYVGTPPSSHYGNVMLALKHGKHVFCEKTFALNEAQAKEMFELARKDKLFLMEANWMVCFPIIQHLVQLLQDGEIGRVNMVQASLGFRADRANAPALFDAELGGGSLMACGVYGVMLSSLIFGCDPSHVTAVGSVPRSIGVDEQCSAVLAFDQTTTTRIAVLSSSIVSENQPCDAVIIGDRGTIRVHGMFCCPTKMTISVSGEEDRVIHEPLPEVSESQVFNFPNSQGLAYEAQHVVDCLKAGLTTSPLVTPELTQGTMRIMDTIRKQIGLQFNVDN